MEMELKVLAGLVGEKLEGAKNSFNELLDCIEPLKKLSLTVNHEMDKSSGNPFTAMILAHALMNDMEMIQNSIREFEMMDSGKDVIVCIGGCAKIMTEIQKMNIKLKEKHIIPSPIKFSALAFNLNQKLDELEKLLHSAEASKCIGKLRSELLYVTTLLTNKLVEGK